MIPKQALIALLASVLVPNHVYGAHNILHETNRSAIFRPVNHGAIASTSFRTKAPAPPMVSHFYLCIERDIDLNNHPAFSKSQDDA